MTHRSYPAAAAVLLLTTTTAAADLIQSGDGTIRNRLCVGESCADNEVFDTNFLGTLKLKALNTRILFEDTSTPGGTSPFTNWALQANGPSFSGDNRFLLRDETAGTTPLSVVAGAPENSLYVAADGTVGLGTSMPQAALQVETTSTEGIRLNRSNVFPSGQAWETTIFANGDFGLSDETNGTTPFAMRPGTPNNAIFLEDDTAQINAGNRDYNFEVRWDQGSSIWGDGGTGDIGMGTLVPDGKLHTKGDGVQIIYFESGDGGPVQVRFRSDSENRRFLATNNANEVQSQLIFKDDEILFTGTTDRGADRWMSISRAGLVTQGPSCDPGPCDAVFDPKVFEVPSIQEHAAYMWENRHLKAVGPTGPDTPVNLTEKVGGILHELELAHIYIEKLHEDAQQKSVEMAGMKARHAREMAVLSARLEALESK